MWQRILFTNVPAEDDAYAAALEDPTAQTKGGWWPVEGRLGAHHRDPLWGREYSMTWEFQQQNTLDPAS